MGAAPPPPSSPGWTPAWIRRRVRNVYKRPFLVGGVAAGCFMVTMLGLVLVPHRTRGAARDASRELVERPDTAAILRRVALVEERARLAHAELTQALTTARALARQREAMPDLSPSTRDSLVAASAELDSLVRRSEEAPLPASYRALGDASVLRGSPRVRELLDTLAGIEATRSGFGATGGVDPIFVALTARAGQIGKQIQEAARGRQQSLQRQIDSLAVMPRRATSSVAALAPAADTAALALMSDSAASEVRAARRLLARARLANQEIDERVARARVSDAASASVPAMLPAALIMGLAVGFGVAFALEVRDPRVADAAEAEITADVNVLTTLGRNDRPQEHRRQADRDLPPLIEPGSDNYRLLHAQLAGRSFDVPLVAVLGDSPMVTSVVAANLAATTARQVRTTLLIDTDFDTNSMATVTRVPAEPGLADVLAGQVEWSAAISSVTVGRDRSMDVLPGGSFGRLPAPIGGDAELARVLEHVTHRYECVVVSVPVSRRGTLPIPTSKTMPAVVCVRTARTPVPALVQLMAALRWHGAPVRGLVIWDRDDPMVSVAVAPDSDA
jgi:hypothetical protein